MKCYLRNYLSFLFLVLLFSCNTIPPLPMDMEESSLIPLPAAMEATGMSFALTAKTKILLKEENPEMERLAAYLANSLQTITGFQTPVEIDEKGTGHHFYIQLENNNSIGEEGYYLNILEDQIHLSANNPAGIFYGIQTILQLFPVQSASEENENGIWRIPTGEIEDSPVYEHRGSMLDVVRHFFEVEDVKRYIDLISHYKMNVLHLHLADDQGWRIHINSWPDLTAIGGKTQVGGGEGGFYTQEEYAGIVQYAADRFITIIPEIDMPGHTNAALASYPELNCDGIAREAYTGTGVGFSSLCIDKEITYQFVGDVIRELGAITPGPYIHIGGDEADATEKADYIRFINRVHSIVEEAGKQMSGWDDISAADLNETAVAQHWRHEENALAAKAQGMKVIMSPASRAYLDMKYDSTTELGLMWAGTIEIDHGYNWDLESQVEGLNKDDILGIEVPLWTETVETMDHIEYLVFPRLPGYAEIGWTAKEQRDWEEYKIRLAGQQERFEAWGIDYYRSPLVPWK